VKPKTRVWLVVIAIVLLLAATYKVLAIYQPPSSRQLMLAGRLTIDSKPLVVAEPERARPIFLVSALYVPGLALLLFALLFRRQQIHTTR
jgi:hypothetical protein